MKNNSKYITLILISLILFFSPFNSIAEEFSISPMLNKGQKWRIAYYEGGPYANYQRNLLHLVKSFIKLGWIDQTRLPELANESDNSQLWVFLANHIQSKYLKFVNGGFYSADWEQERREKIRNKITKRLSEKSDIDLIIAMGTWAGQDLANNKHSVPTIVMSASDPVRAKIINSPEDSGFDHVLAKSDPTRHIRQIRLFHRIVKFRKIGIVFENSDEGRIYAAWDAVVKESKKRGFEVIECHIQETDVSTEEATKQCLECFKRIAPQVDAFWISDLLGTQPQFLPKLMPVLLKYKIPTWTITEIPEHVKGGVLMGFPKQDFAEMSMFYAKTISKIFHGARPRDLDQIFKGQNLIAINTKTAELIDFKIPNSILRIAGEVYNEIEY